MVLSVQKLGKSLIKRPKNAATLSASLFNFQSKVSDSIARVWPKPDPESKTLSLTGLQKCFELIHVTNAAFAKMAVEIDHPMSKWGPELTEEYLHHTICQLDMLNAVSSSLSHLGQARMTILHALTLVKHNNHSSKDFGARKIIPKKIPGKGFEFQGPIGVGERRIRIGEKEHVLLQALILSEKIGVLALGFVVSGLRGDGEVYMEMIRKCGGDDDDLIKGLDLRLRKEVMEFKGVMEEVKGVNSASEGVEELKKRLEEMGKSIQGLEKMANNLFSEVLAARNKLMDNFRLSTGHN